MDAAELEQSYFEMLKDYLNNFNDIQTIDKAPKPIQLAIEKLVKYDSRDATIKSESIADLSKTYADIEGLPQDVLTLIRPYKKVRW